MLELPVFILDLCIFYLLYKNTYDVTVLQLIFFV